MGPLVLRHEKEAETESEERKWPIALVTLRRYPPECLPNMDARPVTADHTLFDEAIAVFRPQEAPLQLPTVIEGPAHVLLDFELPVAINCGNFQLQPTRRVKLAVACAAFVAPLILPPYVNHVSRIHFVVAVSTLISLAVRRPVKTLRGDEPSVLYSLPERDAILALHFPVLIAGPGYHDWQLSGRSIAQYEQSIKAVASLMSSLPFNDYVRFMRAMRLFQLAHNFERDDFALACYLLVSAIETIAERAISRKEAAGPSHRKKKFVQFVFRYCPPSQWAELDHPWANRQSLWEVPYPSKAFGYLTKRHWSEVYLDDLSEQDLEIVIDNLYQYRSTFTHHGAPPPHRDPVSFNRYFEVQTDYDAKRRECRIVLPNFRLISFIAQRAILRYGNELQGEMP